MYTLSRLLLVGFFVLATYFMFLIMPGIAWLAVGAFAFMRIKKNRGGLWSHGTARFASAEDLRGMLDAPQGLILGKIRIKSFFTCLFNLRLTSKEAVKAFFGYSPLVRLGNSVHTLICAPSGAGKGVSFMILHALTCKESMVILDIKNGEIARLTRHAREKIGKVHILDFFCTVSNKSDCINIISLIDSTSPTALDDCRDLAAAIVIRTGHENEAHWLDYSERMITFGIAFVAMYAPEEDRNMQTVVEVLSDMKNFGTAIERAKESNAYGGMLMNMANQMGFLVDREFASVMTTTLRMLDPFNTPSIATVTQKSTFNLASLRGNTETLYIIMPSERLKANAGIIRVILAAINKAVMGCGLQEKNKIHIVIDEANSLGKCDEIAKILNTGRGFGEVLTLVYQSLGQLKACWPDGNDQTVLSNCVQIFFGVNDNATALYVSERLGEKTIIVNSGGTSYGRSTSTSYANCQNNTSWSSNTNSNWSATGRRLLRPEEILSLTPRQAIIFAPGKPPILTQLVRYYEKGVKTGWIKRACGALKILTISLVLFVTSAVAVLRARHCLEMQHENRLDGSVESWGREGHSTGRGGIEPPESAGSY